MTPGRPNDFGNFVGGDEVFHTSNITPLEIISRIILDKESRAIILRVTPNAPRTQEIEMRNRLYTITIELKTGEEARYVVRGDSSDHAKNRMKNRLPGGRETLQCVKNSREYVQATDKDLPRLGE
jgi:hypothetical protein